MASVALRASGERRHLLVGEVCESGRQQGSILRGYGRIFLQGRQAHGAVIKREDPLHSYLGIIKRTSATRAFAPGEVNLQLNMCIFCHVFMKCKDPPLDWLGSSCLLVKEGPFLTQESSEARQDQSAHYRLPRANARQLVIQTCN